MRVLIIDDDPEELELFEDASSDLNQAIQFFEARDCASSIEIISGQTPEVVIIDINLGPYSGIDCLKELRNSTWAQHLPVVMYSTSSNKQQIEKCYREKANYFFVKPNSINELRQILRKLLEIDWKSSTPVNRDAFLISG